MERRTKGICLIFQQMVVTQGLSQSSSKTLMQPYPEHMFVYVQDRGGLMNIGSQRHFKQTFFFFIYLFFDFFLLMICFRFILFELFYCYFFSSERRSVWGVFGSLCSSVFAVLGHRQLCVPGTAAVRINPGVTTIMEDLTDAQHAALDLFDRYNIDDWDTTFLLLWPNCYTSHLMVGN